MFISKQQIAAVVLKICTVFKPLWFVAMSSLNRDFKVAKIWNFLLKFCEVELDYVKYFSRDWGLLADRKSTGTMLMKNKFS